MIARYAYNAHGERIAKTVIAANGVATTTYFLYQGQQLDAEADDNGRVVAHYIYSGHKPLIKLDYPAPDTQKPWWRTLLDWYKIWLRLGTDPNASRVYAIHTDHLGTPRSMTDAQQRVVWQATYTAFGKATVTIAAATLNLRLPGQYFDGETGGHYNYFRDYDPQTGRYIQSDPIGLNGGPNTYTYVGGNQLSFVDPLGLDRWGSYGYGRYIPSTNPSPSFWEKLNFPETPEQRAFGQKLIDGFAGGICGPSKATTTLFRAVTQGEAAQIARTGTFQAGENSLGGKWFALSAEHAQQWGDAMNGVGKSTILKVDIATSTVATFFRNNRLDNIGPAVYGELDQLKNAVIQVLK